MKKKLIIVTTDMEIELAMFVDANKITDTRKAIANARKKYYEENYNVESFDYILSESMKEHGIDFEIIEYEEM